jgi:hypothetical protein
MKKLLSMALILFVSHAALAQDSAGTAKKVAKFNLANRPNDHFMIIFGYDNWAGKPDTIQTSGFSRSFAFYFMMDFPFKTDPHWSVGAGLGIGASNIYFNKQEVLVQVDNPTLAFPNTTNSSYHFKKYKLVTSYLEVPLELRYAFHPENTNNSWKIAVGVKPGIMLSAYTKGKDVLNTAGQLIQSSIEKESSKQFFNTARLVGTVRVSYGFIGIFGQLQLTGLIKNGLGPTLNPYSIGIVLSGL